jgi:hypothetical protein
MSKTQLQFNQSQAYLKDQSLLEEVKQTHKLMVNKNVRGETVGYTINILMQYAGRFRWMKVASGSSRIKMIQLYKDMIKKVVHNRMVATAWDDSD